MEAKIRRDYLRGGLVAFLQADDIGTAQTDDFDAVAQAEATLNPDVKT
jgi:hypothetical protein